MRSAVAFEGKEGVEVDDGEAFPVFHPVVARDQCVVFVGFAVAVLPVVKLRACDAQPGDDLEGAQAGAFSAPFGNEIDDLVADIMRGPGIGQASPRLFFKRTCSSMSSASDSLRRVSLFSKARSLRS